MYSKYAYHFGRFNGAESILGLEIVVVVVDKQIVG